MIHLASFPNLLEVDWSQVDWLFLAGRLHPVLLHLPIGLLILLFMVELHGLLLRKEERRDGTRNYLVGLLLFTAPMAAASGWFLAEEGYGEGIDLHRWFGVGTAVLSVLTCVAYMARARAYGGLLFLAFAGVVGTGHLGGETTHGDGFLFEPLEDAIPGPPSRVDGVTPSEEGDDPDPRPGPGAGSEATDAAELAPEQPTEPVTRAAPTWADVEPILADYCTNCHGARRQKADLALHTEALVLGGDEYGSIVTPGDPANSYLIEVLHLPLDADEHMPPDDKPQPSADELAVLEAWIAGLDAEDVATTVAGGDAEVTPTTEGAPEGPSGPEDDAPDLPDAGPAPATTTAPALTTPPTLTAPERAKLEALLQDALDRSEAQVLAALAEVRAVVVPLRGVGDEAAVSMDLTGAELQPGELLELVGGGALSVRQAVLFGKEVARADLLALRSLAAGGLETLELRGLTGPPLDLEPLTVASDLLAANRLRNLNLAGTTLAAGAVEHLANLPELEVVVIWDTGLTEADLLRLAELRPDLRVVGEAAPPSEPIEVEPEVVFRRVDEADEGAAEAAPDAGALPGTLVAENATCPVSGDPVDPRYTVLYEGRLIGFCCPNCPSSFWDDPAPYLAKLD